MKANSLGIIFDLFSLTSVSYESHPPPNGGLDPLLCEELPLLHCQTQALTRGPIHWWQRETLDHTKLWACIVHKLASPLQFLAHLMLDSLVPTARPFLPLLFQTGDVEGLGSRLLQKVCLLCHVIVYVVMVSMLFYYKITVKHNLKMHTNIYLYKAHSDNHNMLTQLYTYSHAVNYPSSLYVSNFAHITYSDVILYCAYQRHFALLFWVNDLHRFWSRTNSAPFGREVEKEEWVFTHTCMQGYKVQTHYCNPYCKHWKCAHFVPCNQTFRLQKLHYLWHSGIITSHSQALPVSFPGPSRLVPRPFLHGSGFWWLAVLLISMFAYCKQAKTEAWVAEI